MTGCISKPVIIPDAIEVPQLNIIKPSKKGEFL